jgi:hypothetical protein
MNICTVGSRGVCAECYAADNKLAGVYLVASRKPSGVSFSVQESAGCRSVYSCVMCSLFLRSVYLYNVQVNIVVAHVQMKKNLLDHL